MVNGHSAYLMRYTLQEGNASQVVDELQLFITALGSVVHTLSIASKASQAAGRKSFPSTVVASIVNALEGIFLVLKALPEHTMTKRVVSDVVNCGLLPFVQLLAATRLWSLDHSPEHALLFPAQSIASSVLALIQHLGPKLSPSSLHLIEHVRTHALQIRLLSHSLFMHRT